MTPIEEAFIRVTTLLDDPDAPKNRAEIVAHLDTVIDYARSDEETRRAYDFKAMALNHVDSIGCDRPDIIKAKFHRALDANRALNQAILQQNFEQDNR